MKPATAFAPAKINLFLHVGATASDGYHPLTSWMTFADIGDTISLAPANALDFQVRGRFAQALQGEGDNLVVRARDALLKLAVRPVAPFRLILDKDLPVASGMGGGSSDAAATLRLVGKALGVHPDHQIAIAATLGADVPACLYAGSVMARGREKLSESPRMPVLPAVLVNPGVAVSTGEIFKAFDAGAPGNLGDGDPPRQFGAVGEVIEYLSVQRNDLEPCAKSLQPIIGDVLAALAEEPETRMARMTGSGATVFALCETSEAALQLSKKIQVRRPDWWCAACHLS